MWSVTLCRYGSQRSQEKKKRKRLRESGNDVGSNHCQPISSHDERSEVAVAKYACFELVYADAVVS